MTIWKYNVPVEDEVTLEMPKGARLLSFQAQEYDLVLWALVDPNANIEMRRFNVYGTGHPIPSIEQQYIGTAQEQGVGSLVWHLFEVFE